MNLGKVAGLDLSGSEKKPSGWCLIDGRRVTTKLLYSDDEILNEVTNARPVIIAIDAPLTMPKEGGFRHVDKELMKLKGKPLPPLMPGMRSLTMRAIGLITRINELSLNIKILETHPQTAASRLNVSRSSKQVLEALKAYGLKPFERNVSKHEVDAMLAALTAWLYLIGKVEEVKADNGIIVLPKKED